MASPLSFLTSTAMPIEWLDNSRYITAIGCNLAIGTVDNPAQNEFLEGHSQVISCFTIDNTKRFCASGQCGKESHTEVSVPVIVWDLVNKTQKLVLRGHKSAIRLITFSDNARLLAVTDELTNKIWVWDVEQEDLACFINTPLPASCIRFGGSQKDTWLLHVTFNKYLIEYTIHFDERTFEYKTTERPYANPTTGYKRTYDTSNFVYPYLLVGTHAGELAVYNASTLTVRANIQVDTFSIACIALTEDPQTVVVAGRKFSICHGSDKEWTVVKQTELDVPIVSVSVLNGKAICRTVDTGIYIIDMNRLTRRQIHIGLYNKPSRIAVTNDTVAVALEDNGLVIVKIEGDNLETFKYLPKIHASAVAATPLNDFVVGCMDGGVLEIDSYGEEKWVTERVHRGKVTAICVTPEFIASGGGDGILRVLTHQTRTLINEIVCHNGPILQIIPAFMHQERVHTVSTDRTVNTTDISTGKRICQSLISGRISFTSIQQFTDGETEIIAAMGDGTIKGYDWPRPGIVLEQETPQHLQINSIALRPNTRLVACGGESEYISLCDFNTGEWKLSGTAHSTTIHNVVFTPDGKYMLSVANDGLCLWRIDF